MDLKNLQECSGIIRRKPMEIWDNPTPLLYTITTEDWVSLFPGKSNKEKNMEMPCFSSLLSKEAL